MPLPRDVTILFQGDSITDCGRDRTITDPNVGEALGVGYAHFAAAGLLGRVDAGGLRVLNRGVGGDRVTSLDARWQADCLDLKPDLLSILIGVNDTWHGVAKGDPAGSPSIPDYDRIYRKLLDLARGQNPDLRLVLLEPFVLDAGPGAELNFHPDLDHRREVVAKIASDYDAIFVPLQQVFDDRIATGTPPDVLANDGVHPTLTGHGLIAQTWLDAVLPTLR
jgi:lysophospholipase L1-like esterase